jgi:phosphoglycerate dehydrogenase-like enzyme
VNVLVCIHSQFAMWNIPPPYVERLRTAFPADTFLHAKDERDGLRLIPEADAAFSAQVTRGQLAAAPRLKWIHSPAAGVGGMLFPEMIASPVVITNSRGMSADTIAEHVLAVTLAMFRRLPHAFRSQAAREWAQDAIGTEGNRMLAGSDVVVVGLGAIGSAVASRMTGLGARVIGVRRHADRARPGTPATTPVVSSGQLHEVLPNADVVIVAAPHTSETRGLIDAAALRLMSRDTILVNVSRGQLIDEAALIAALRERRIAGAALDVFVDEPLPRDSPFWTLPNVLITPHTSGFRPDHWDAATALFADNLTRFHAGQPLVNVVNKADGY